MSTNTSSVPFLNSLIEEALDSSAVNHPYLSALSSGDFPDYDFALRDFAFQYGIYSRDFIVYLTSAIDLLSNDTHKAILQENLDEEKGGVHHHEVELAPDILAKIIGIPHSQLYQKFQEAVGVDEQYKANNHASQFAILWNKQFLALCNINENIGVGALGIGTELIVSRIYKQILQGISQHSHLNAEQRVFFDLHSECDDEHAAQFISIAEALAQDESSLEQIEYGVKMALSMRSLFWDKMHQRALSHRDTINTLKEEISIG